MLRQDVVESDDSKGYKQMIPLHSLVLMVGLPNSGKTHFCDMNFEDYEVVRPESMRYALVGDELRDDIQGFTTSICNSIVDNKLRLGERVVIDSTNITYIERLNYINIAKRYDVPIFYIVFPATMNGNQIQHRMKKDIDTLSNNIKKILSGDDGIATSFLKDDNIKIVKKISRSKTENDIFNNFGGIMVIGDVHGNYTSLCNAIEWAKSRNRFMIFLGDIIDYGDRNVDTINTIYDLVINGKAITIIGNHEHKIYKWFSQYHKGSINLSLNQGNLKSISEFLNLNNKEFMKIHSRFNCIFTNAAHHWVTKNILFTHAACNMKMFEIYNNRLYGKLKNMALFGQTNDNGTKCYDWIDSINNRIVMVGHDIRSNITPYIVRNNRNGVVYFMDTGSSKGGILTSADIIMHNGKLSVKNFINHF